MPKFFYQNLTLLIHLSASASCVKTYGVKIIIASYATKNQACNSQLVYQKKTLE